MNSFEQIPRWLELVHAQSPAAMVILVGCKSDLDSVRVVSKNDADAMARQHGMPYFETSSRDNSNVDRTFRFVAVTLRQLWLTTRVARSAQTSATRVVQPGRQECAPKKDGCC